MDVFITAAPFVILNLTGMFPLPEIVLLLKLITYVKE